MAPSQKVDLFKVGDEVEVSSDEEGFKGAWFEARVVRSPNRAGRYTVAYDADKPSPLRVTFDAAHIRPRPPPRSPPGGLVLPHQPVEVLHNGAWWSGVVSWVREGRPGSDGERRYSVRFPTGEECVYGLEELRPRMEWVGGEWVEPAPQKMATSSQQDGPSRTSSPANAPQSQESDTDLRKMVTSSQQDGPSRTSSPANAPQSQESDTDLRPEVAFNLSGSIIGGKNALKNRCLTLLKTQIGLAYDDWRQVEQAKKDDIWDTLFTEFKMPADRKDEVLKEISTQLKTWKRNLRSKYFEGLDSDGIKALKDKVPEKEKIPLSQWNEFIKCEASEAKINQRDRAKGNRAKKTDIHCLGRMSYAEKTEEMMRKDPLRRLPERSDVFIESRRQKKTGEFHPKIAEEIQKLTELKSSQEFLSQTTLENDALTIFYGKDARGRTRGVGPVSKSKLKAITPIRSEIEKVVKQRNVQVEQDMCEIKQSLNILLRAYSESQRFPPHHLSPQPGSLSNHSNPATPSHPTPSSSSRYDIFSLSNTKKIATGVIALSATPGTVVHGHVLLEYERKVKVIDVVPGEEQQGLYLGSQGCATTIKETEGGWVVWPIWLLH